MQNLIYKFKVVILDWVPPKLISILKSFRRNDIQFKDWYISWGDAVKNSKGYFQDDIATKVLSSTLKVKHGEAIFERDSVVFDEIHYSWPVLSGLLFAAALSGGKLDVLDFGGSLGSSYFQNRKFLKYIDDLHWSIIEQEKFVSLGKVHIQDDVLKFYKTIDEQRKCRQSNVILLSAVLQYLSKPYEVLDQLLKLGPNLVIFDRTSFISHGDKEKIRLQNVSNKIYEASYPCWFLSRLKLENFMRNNGYELLESFDSDEDLDPKAKWMGLIFIKCLFN